MQKMTRYILITLLAFPTMAFAAVQSSLQAVTKPVVNLKYDSVTLQADVTPASDVPDNVYHFEWGLAGNDSNAVFMTEEGSMYTYTRSVTAQLRGLAPNTQYYVRIVGENQRDHVVGQTIFFTTRPYNSNPEAYVIATTRNATAITDTSATVRAYVAPHGDSARYWFEWGIDKGVGQVTSDRSVWSNGGEVTVDLSGLVPGTTYYYRVAAQNDRGTVRGSVQSFKTTGTRPPIEAQSPQDQPTTGTRISGQSNGQQSRSSDSSLFGGWTTDTKGSSAAKPETNGNGGSNSSLTGSVANATNDAQVAVTANGNGGAHQAIEYRVSYSYSGNSTVRKAALELYVPATLIYTGDTTANELRVKKSDNGARIFILPIGTMKAGDNRSFSFLAMTTGDASGIPEVKANLSYTQAFGSVASVGASSAKSSSWSLFGGSSKSNTNNTNNAAAAGSAMPTTLIWWLVFLNIIAAAALGLFKLKNKLADVRARAADEQSKADDVAAKIRAEIAQKMGAPAPMLATEAVSNVPTETPAVADLEQELDATRDVSIDDVGLPGMYAV